MVNMKMKKPYFKEEYFKGREDEREHIKKGAVRLILNVVYHAASDTSCSIFLVNLEGKLIGSFVLTITFSFRNNLSCQRLYSHS